MNKTAIKNFATWARVNLIEAVKQRAFEYEVTETGENKSGLSVIAGRPLSKDELTQRNQLVSQIKQKGYTQVMEEAAYTWFNRFIALRFMEVNGYLPSQTRVFTDENGAFAPQLLKDALRVDLDGLDREKVMELMDSRSDEALYKYLFITQCNAMSKPLPGMFEKISDWTELLFPANLLRQDSVIGRMVADIPEEDWTDQVQIIGWLYQYYNAELKDETFALLKKNQKITKERIPAATQLFTPDWIVRYMVENSLGRLWLEGHPNDALKAGWKYYLEEAEQEPEVAAQLEKLRSERAALKPEEIKFIDPCMGSGHILVYAFDVLMQIYLSAGWSERDAAQSIVENNIFGLDIDERATQLSYFAVMMKARQYDRRFLTRKIQPQVYATKGDAEGSEYGSLLICDDPGPMPEQFDLLGGNMDSWHYRKLLIQKYDVVVTNPPYMALSNASSKMSDYVKDNFLNGKADLFAAFIERCGMMCRYYQAMITQHAWMFLSSFERLRGKLMVSADIVNMAHLGARAFDEIGGEVVQTTSFVLRSEHSEGYQGTYCRLIDPATQQGKEDMFLAGESRYTAQQTNFSKIPGSPVAYWISKALITTFSNKKIGDMGDANNGFTTGDNDRFLRLWFEVPFQSIGLGMKDAQSARISGTKWFPYNKGGSFRKWYGNNDYLIDWENDGKRIKDYGHLVPRSLRYQFKPSISWSKISSSIPSFRAKAEGTMFDVAGLSLFPSCDEHYNYFLGMCNSCFAQVCLGFLSPTLNYETGHIASIPVIISEKNRETINVLVANCVELSSIDWNSYETSWDFQRHPLLRVIAQHPHDFDNIAAIPIYDCYLYWKQECEERFQRLKANEEELNRIFIDIYGLQDELAPEVADKDITVHRIFDTNDDVPESMKGSAYVRTKRDEILSLISYAVGCLFGRYSLNAEGLVYAGGDWTDIYARKAVPLITADNKYIVTSDDKVLHVQSNEYCILKRDGEEIELTVYPDSDNIIPICDDDYFEDDLTGRFVKWVETVYGKDTLEENLKFIADALGGKGTSREVIRAYFLNDFYADHLKTYQKRPIYWLFSSGKKNGFKALIYMHRYQPDVLARMRTDYVHEQQERYRTQIVMLEESIDRAAPSERVKLTKQLTKLRDQAAEIQSFEEKVHHLADQMIAIDLDDGVKVNYAKFEDVLEKIK